MPNQHFFGIFTGLWVLCKCPDWLPPLPALPGAWASLASAGDAGHSRVRAGTHADGVVLCIHFKANFEMVRAIGTGW